MVQFKEKQKLYESNLRFSNRKNTFFVFWQNQQRIFIWIYNGEGKPHTDFSVTGTKQGRKEEVANGNMDIKAIVHQRRDMSRQKLLV